MLRWRLALLVSAAIAISYLDRQTLPVAIKAISQDIPISNEQFSLLQSSFLLAYAVIAQPGLVSKPYTVQDAQNRLAELSGDRKFADDFFSRFITGTEAPDYAQLLAPAGIVVRKRNPGAAWTGLQMDRQDATQVGSLVPFGTPAFAAGIEEEDVIVSADGAAFSTLAAALKEKKPGQQIAMEVRKPWGEVVKTTLTLAEDPALAAGTIESAGGALTPEMKAFRESWAGSKAR